MRYAALLILGAVLAAPSSAALKADSTRATVTYVAGDAVYLSVGRNAGVQDSSLCYILDKKDTVVVLKVIATSSKSAVCGILRSTRAVAVGDAVRIPSSAADLGAQQPAPIVDTAAVGAAPVSPRKAAPGEPPAVALHGRVSAQYFMTRQSGAGSNMTRPGLVINLRGAARDIPLSFEIYCNLRSLSYGDASPFGRGGINQSRIYTLMLRYDDGDYRIAAGRLSSSPLASAGAVDGLLFSRRFDDLTLGVTGGFEPLFSQRSFGSEYRKASVFASYALPGSVPGTATAGYTRRYYHALLDRDVATASLFFTPSGEWTMSAQGDVDLHQKRDRDLVPRAVLSNLYGSVHYKASPAVALGLGISAWRPTYAFSSVAAVPDSMLDYTLRTSPSLDLSLSLPAGISLFNTYSARSSAEGFGKEYSDYASVNFGNLFNQGLSARGSFSLNSTIYAKMRGAGGALQRAFGGFLDATVRYQWYRYEYSRWGGTNTTNTAGVDLMVYAVRSVTFWGSVERLMSTDINTTSVSVDIGWRF
jgi:hypothetical protein